MSFTIVDQGSERTITVRVPSIGCGEDRTEIPKPVWDLICIFEDVYSRAKTGTPPSGDACTRKSLHEMAVAQSAPSR
jgi:hypothetical protein